MSRTVQNLGITVPKIVMEKLDVYRGDVSRSRYVTRLLEKSFNQSMLAVQESKKVVGDVLQTAPTTELIIHCGSQ